MVTDDIKLALIEEFQAMASRYNNPGWIEYSFWETIEGLKDKPIPFFEPLRDDELDVLRMLRDEAQIWVFWKDQQWFVIDITSWRTHAKTRTSKDVMDEQHTRNKS